MPPVMMMVVMMVPVREVLRAFGRDGVSGLRTGEAEAHGKGDDGNDCFHSCADDSIQSRSLVVSPSVGLPGPGQFCSVRVAYEITLPSVLPGVRHGSRFHQPLHLLRLVSVAHAVSCGDHQGIGAIAQRAGRVNRAEAPEPGRRSGSSGPSERSARAARFF